MTNLTQFSLKNPVAVVILVLLLLSGGIYTSFLLNQESMPDLSAPVIYVNVVYPGASAEETLNSVTAPLEKALQSVEGVKNVTSNTSDSISFIRVEFDLSDDLDLKKSKVDEAINTVTLPQAVLKPHVMKNSASSNPIFYSSLIPKDGVSEAKFQDTLKNHIIPEVKSLNGVGNVQTLGLQTSRVLVSIDPEKLKQNKLTYPQVAQFLQEQNFSNPLGEVTMNKKTEMVTLQGSIVSMNQLSNLKLQNDPILRLKDIAKIQKDTTSETIASVNGKPAVAFNIMKNNGANTVNVIKLVQKQLQKYDQTVKLNVIYDSSKDIKNSVSSLTREGLMGAAFASLLILVFLRNFRATIISIISIPLSVLITLICMHYLNLPLNIMTLAGMAVATGRVVDDSIVVIENIIRRLQVERMSQELIICSVKEVAKAITSSTLTTIAVFAPLALLSGIVGIVFGPFAITVVICLVSSLIVSVTVVPMLAYLMMRKSDPQAHKESEVGWTLIYKRALNWSLNHKTVVLVLACVLLIGSLPLAGMVGFTFLQDGEDKMVALQLTMPRGTPLAEIERYAKKIDQKLLANNSVENSQLVVGSPKGQSKTDPMTNIANWSVSLKPDTNIDTFIKEQKAALRPSEANTTLDLYRISATASGSDIQITVNGSDRASITQTAELITNKIKSIQGTENVKNNLQEGSKGIELKVRHQDALEHGLSSAQIYKWISPYLSEQKLGTLSNGTLQDDVFIRLKPENGLPSLDEISNLELLDPTGHLIQIKDIADVREIDQPGSLQLLNGQEYSTVTARIVDTNKGAVNKKVKESLQSLTLPNGASYSLGGVNQQMDDMMKDMGMAIFIAIGAVYVVMVITFGEGRAPFAILFSIPFALIGSLVATLIADQPISLSSMIGFLMLIGIVVTNAIVLLDRAGQHIAKGDSIRESLLAAGVVRLRPILMTAIATMMAILPLVLGLGESTLISQGLAVVVIGGLISSTFLTLFIVPIMFELLHLKRVKQEQKVTINFKAGNLKYS